MDRELACVEALCCLVRTKHGRVSHEDAETFLASRAKLKRVAASVGVQLLVERHGSSVPYPLEYVALRSVIEFQGARPAMLALAVAAHAAPRLPGQNLLGQFRTQHPEYAFMWANKALVSCKRFVDLHAPLVSSSWSIAWEGEGVNQLLPKLRCEPIAAVPSARPTTASSMHVEFINTRARGKQVFEQLSASTVLFLDLEGDLTPKGRLCLLQVAGTSIPDTVFVMDTFTCPGILRDPVVKRVLSKTLVVLHDGRHDTVALRGQFQLELSSVFDTQVAHQVLVGNDSAMVGLNHVLSTYANMTNTVKDQVQHRDGLWSERPLPPHLLDYAAQDVMHLPVVYSAMKARMSDGLYATCLARSKIRTTDVSPDKLRQALANTSTYLREAGGHIHVSSMDGLYAAYPDIRDMIKAKGTLSTFFEKFGNAVTPPIAIVDDNLTLQTMTPAVVMKHLAAYIQAVGGTMPAASLSGFYDVYPGAQDVMKPTANAKATAFVQTHGPSSTPPVYVQGTWTFVLDRSAADKLPSAAQLLKDFGARFARDKYGVAITDDGAFFSAALTVHVPTTQLFVVANKSTQTMLLRTCFRVMASKAALKSSPFTIAFSGPTPVKPHESVSVPCQFRSTAPGRFNVVLAFEFSTPTQTVFAIGRVLEGVDCVDPAMDAETLQSIQDGTARRRKTAPSNQKLQFDAPAHRATAPIRYGPPLAVPLGKHVLPATWAAVDTDLPLTMATYSRRFQDLLYREEREHLRQQQEFDMERATLVLKTPVLFELAVPGLAEGRPSLMAGDKVLVNQPKSNTMEGIITQVRLDGIYIAMPPAFHRTHFDDHQKFNVRFVSSRTPVRLQHQGLLALSPPIHETLLFPTLIGLRTSQAAWFGPPGGDRVSAIDRQYSRPINLEQARAIDDIEHLVATASSNAPLVPYLLFGPPGTGKTVTIVESIEQILRAARKNASKAVHILACAPSNAAADNIVDRLAGTSDITSNELRRVMAFSRRVKDTPASVLPFTTIAARGHDGDGFVQPTLDDLQSTSIIVSTIATGAKLFNMGVKRGFFDLIVFDEAAQATEPDVCSVLGPLASSRTVVVLAGDPMQLGPVIKSTYGITLGLGRSLMERLLPLYQQAATQAQPRTPWSTKLVRNYRSHRDILSVPNELFYDGDLVACAPTSMTHSLLEWPSLPNRSVPLLFHGISGGELQTNDSPSWYNPYELQLVLEYVESLVEFGVLPAEMGVITPYAKQRQKIQEALQRHGAPSGIVVGSVEQFQGGERRVIIVSTVRSSAGFFKDDSKFQLGFVAHPKRFNVAVTRAKALLIVVGNPAVLETSSDWAAFL
ncbi:hypothetical protein DYB32_009204, partial [Aphanomyces invadans]